MSRNVLFAACVLMSLAATSMQARSSESSDVVHFREANDSVYCDDVHTKRKIPGMMASIPLVEYVPEQGQLIFESAVCQSVSFYIVERTNPTAVVLSGNLELAPGCETALNLCGLEPVDNLDLYICLNGRFYVGKIE